MAFSRVLNDEEVLVVVNTAVTTPPPLAVIIDSNLHADGSNLSLLYSNRATPTAPSPVFTVGNAGPISITELDGSTSTGPARVVTVTLGPREAQILG